MGDLHLFHFGVLGVEFLKARLDLFHDLDEVLILECCATLGNRC